MCSTLSEGGRRKVAKNSVVWIEASSKYLRELVAGGAGKGSKAGVCGTEELGDEMPRCASEALGESESEDRGVVLGEASGVVSLGDSMGTDSVEADLCSTPDGASAEVGAELVAASAALEMASEFLECSEKPFLNCLCFESTSETP